MLFILPDAKRKIPGGIPNVQETKPIHHDTDCSLLLPAIERFSGVVYKALDYASLPQTSKTYIAQHVAIMTGGFGLVKANQLIGTYGIEISKTHKMFKTGIKDQFVVDLLPQAHKKALYYHDGIRVEFIIQKGTKKMPAGHQGKWIKGRFMRFCAVQNVQNVQEMLAFSEDGYQAQQVNKHLITYTKQIAS
ncbi:MAG: peroxide stress protein YaaA [Candidatus Woesearchaeota archaeon]